MRKTLLLGAVMAGLMIGCATRDHHHSSSSYQHYDSDQNVVVHSDGSRTYVREYESPAGSDRHYENDSRLQPRYRGKHPDALGWNDPYWYDSTRY
jgi:hypothetical protein